MIRFPRFLLTITILAHWPAGVNGQEQPDPKELARLGQPGPEHARLHAQAGSWTLTVEGMKEKGKAEFKTILGGRFVMEEVKLPLGKFSMEWVGIYGYDRQSKKYTAVWVDNMDTTTESGEGEGDATGKTLTFRGRHLDPRTGKQTRFVWRIVRNGDAALRIEMGEVDEKDKEEVVFVVKGEKTK